MAPHDSPKESLAGARPRWRRRVLIAIAAVTALWLLHAPLLRSVGSFLVADEPLAKTDYIVILPWLAGDSVAIEPAIQRVLRGDAGGLVFFEMPSTRGERCGAWPDYATAVRAYLKGRGLADRSIVFVPGPSRTSWEAAHALGRWLEQWPDQRAIPRLDLLCQRFRGPHERHVFAAVLPREIFDQLHFAAADGRIDETNWWPDREGIQMVFQSYVELAYMKLHGEPNNSGKQWTLDQYEQSLPTTPPAK